MSRIVLLAGAIVSLSIVASIDVSATQAKELTQLQLCKKFLGFGITAQTLESTCNIKGSVSKKALSIYMRGGCREVVPQSEVDAVAADVASKMQAQINAPGVGKATFCAGGRDWYREKLDGKHWFDYDPDRTQR